MTHILLMILKTFFSVPEVIQAESSAGQGSWNLWFSHYYNVPLQGSECWYFLLITPCDCHCDSGLEPELLLVHDTIWSKAFIMSPVVFRTILKACSCWEEELPENQSSPWGEKPDISGSQSSRDSLKLSFMCTQDSEERRKISLHKNFSFLSYFMTSLARSTFWLCSPFPARLSTSLPQPSSAVFCTRPWEIMPMSSQHGWEMLSLWLPLNGTEVKAGCVKALLL